MNSLNNYGLLDVKLYLFNCKNEEDYTKLYRSFKDMKLDVLVGTCNNVPCFGITGTPSIEKNIQEIVNTIEEYTYHVVDWNKSVESVVDLWEDNTYSTKIHLGFWKRVDKPDTMYDYLYCFDNQYFCVE